MSDKILLTGSKGYIGSYLAKSLNKDNEVILFDRGADLNIIKGCNVVYHLASSVSMSEKVEWKNINNDLHFTINLLDKCVEYGIKSIIFTSSGGTIYGPARGPIDETYPTIPICPYGMLKLTVENYIKFYCDLYNFNYTILRVSNPYGGTAKKGIIHQILKAIKNNESFTLRGDGLQVRDFIYIDDLIEVMTLIHSNNLRGIFNIGTGNGISLKKLIEDIQTITKKKLSIIYKPRRLIDSQYNVLDITKLINSIMWTPKIDLIEGINRTKGQE